MPHDPTRRFRPFALAAMILCGIVATTTGCTKDAYAGNCGLVQQLNGHCGQQVQQFVAPVYQQQLVQQFAVPVYRQQFVQQVVVPHRQQVIVQRQVVGHHHHHQLQQQVIVQKVQQQRQPRVQVQRQRIVTRNR